MNIEEYFERYGAKHVATVASKAGTNLAYLRQCKYGVRRMSASLALKLELGSNGEMTARELRPDLPWPSIPSAQPEQVA